MAREDASGHNKMLCVWEKGAGIAGQSAGAAFEFRLARGTGGRAYGADPMSLHVKKWVDSPSEAGS
jgi:hypothetical protein